MSNHDKAYKMFSFQPFFWPSKDSGWLSSLLLHDVFVLSLFKYSRSWLRLAFKMCPKYLVFNQQGKELYTEICLNKLWTFTLMVQI